MLYVAAVAAAPGEEANRIAEYRGESLIIVDVREGKAGGRPGTSAVSVRVTELIPWGLTRRCTRPRRMLRSFIVPAAGELRAR